MTPVPVIQLSVRYYNLADLPKKNFSSTLSESEYYTGFMKKKKKNQKHVLPTSLNYGHTV